MSSSVFSISEETGISKHEDVVSAVSQQDGSITLTSSSGEKSSVEGDLFGAKPATKVWIKPNRDGPAMEYTDVEYIMRLPNYILIRQTTGLKYQTSGKILHIESK